MPCLRPRGWLSAAGIVLVLAASASCGGGESPPAQSLSVNPSGVASPTPAVASSSATPVVLSRAQAAKRYTSLADAYRRARKPLDRALDQQPVDMAAVRKGAAEAAAAYRARISGLLDTMWPADVKSLIDDYVTKAARGLNLLIVASKAKLLSDITAAASQDSTNGINAADTLVRVKLGLPTVEQP